MSKILENLILNISADSAELRSGLNKANKQISDFTGGLTKIAGIAGIAFGTKEILGFGLEVSKLAGEFQGVQNAFQKIEGSSKLMDQLKVATQGTVSELDLMKRAVQFQNFNLNLAELPKLLEFATKRAQQTGQSVDYLVDSIVTGLGRKSVLILDNLGISSQQLNAELQKTPDFVKAVGNIVDGELGKMADTIETNYTNLQRLNASWENYKAHIGDVLNSTGFLGKSLQFISDVLDGLAGKKITKVSDELQKFADAGFAQLAQQLKNGGDIATTVKTLTDLRLNLAQPIKVNADDIIRQFQLSTEQAEVFKRTLNDIQGALTEQEKKERAIAATVKAAFDSGNVEAYVKALGQNIYREEIIAEIRKRQAEELKSSIPAIQNIAYYTDLLAKAQERQKQATAESLPAINDEIAALEEKVALLKTLTNTTNKTNPPNVSALPPQKLTGAGLTDGLFTKDDVDKSVDNINLVTKKATDGAYQASTAWDDVGASIQENIGGLAVSSFDSLGTAIGGLITGQKSGFKGLVTSILGGIKQIITAYLAAAIAGATSQEVSKAGLYGLATAAIAIAGIEAIFASLPAFAKGGQYGGGLAVVGENGPEIIDFNRGGYIHNAKDTASMLSGTQTINVVGVVRGEDLHFVTAENNRYRNNSK